MMRITSPEALQNRLGRSVGLFTKAAGWGAASARGVPRTGTAAKPRNAFRRVWFPSGARLVVADEDSGKVVEWATPDHQGSLVRVVASARSLFRGDLGNGMRLFVGARIDKKRGKDTGKNGNGAWRGANDRWVECCRMNAI
jgi:hypothetical protein